MGKHIAIFDLDGTLYDGRVWRAFIRHHFTHKVHRHEAALYLTRNFGKYALFKLGVLPRDAVWNGFAREIVKMVRGMDEAEARQVFERIYDESIRPNLDPLLLQRWETFGEKGIERFVISGSPQPLLDVIGERLRATATFGTRTAQRDGRYTGEIEGELCQNEEKAHRMLAFVAEQGWEVEWEHSHSFADSYGDLPILELVGQPTVVRPDPRLYAHAQAAGWPIIGEASAQ